jgi:hypothetical protein
LLCVVEGQALEASEDDWICKSCQRCVAETQIYIKTQLTVGDDDRVFSLNRLVGNSFGQVDSQQDRVHLPTDRVEGSLKQDCSAKGKLHGA